MATKAESYKKFRKMISRVAAIVTNEFKLVSKAKMYILKKNIVTLIQFSIDVLFIVLYYLVKPNKFLEFLYFGNTYVRVSKSSCCYKIKSSIT